MKITIKWLGHASFRITDDRTVIYIDPWKISQKYKDANLILVSHMHHDHYSEDDIAGLANDHTNLVASADVIARHGSGNSLMPGKKIEKQGIEITGIPAYNPAKEFHPRTNNWLGFIIELGGKRIYYAGDTDLIPEMADLTNIDLALLPVGGTYTMDAQEAGQATGKFNPQQAIPYHWGDIVGEKSDAEKFAQEASCKVNILVKGGSILI
ncbi:MAG: MBL fold metallo-hydrolase [Sedimentisphaerales bacterium]|nr:MBL fold metallo-hydrolase [Sedimentisphaerales bacterium]